ncbi:alpha/beta hydrolase [Microbacterium sp. B2969]|uniref:Alpha/beta hydrolase n=1 Tax=Microbacterium alkaliflavum TaxID=3248839 RepID=A0ABW7QDD1_9MICO
MPIDPYLRTQLRHLDSINSFTDLLSDPSLIASLDRSREDPGPWVPPTLTIEEEDVPGPHGPVRIRRYQPPGRNTNSLPQLVWLHGGGFASGDIDMNEAHMVASELAARTPAVIVSVDYRVAAGDVVHPIPLDDVEAVWLHLDGSDHVRRAAHCTLIRDKSTLAVSSC